MRPINDKDEARKNAREYINRRPLSDLWDIEKKPGATDGSMICPLCGYSSQDHPHGTYHEKRYNGRWQNTCFLCGGFDTNGHNGCDTLEALRIVTGWSEEAVLREYADYDPYKDIQEGYEQHKAEKEASRSQEEPSEVNEEKDFTKYFTRCSEALRRALEPVPGYRDPDPKATDYLKKRGLSIGTLKRFRIGIDYDSHRITIPFLGFKTGTRRAYTEAEVENGKYRDLGRKGLFGLSFKEKPVFLVEGAFDCMSIVECGFGSVALNSTDNWRAFPGFWEDYKFPVVIALDKPTSETDGKNIAKATEGLSKALQELQIPFVVADPVKLYGPYKDANERLQGDREGLVSALREYSFMAENQEAYEYLSEHKEGFLRGYLDKLTSRSQEVSFSTGFPSLDDLMNGGLHPQLTVIGAITGLGKTTLMLQIMNQVARAGQDVMIASLEMGREELQAKAVSMHSAMASIKEYKDTAYAFTGGEIMDLNAQRYKDLPVEKKAVLEASVSAYASYEDHVFYEIGMDTETGELGVEALRKRLEVHRKARGSYPVLLVDYIQIMAPYDPRMDEKRNMDRNIVALKRISRDFGIPVLVISSLNRMNYSAPINLTAFKESGALEYTSDCAIGLQYFGYDPKDGESDGQRLARLHDLMKDVEAKMKNRLPIKVQVKMLKNRHGLKGSTVLDFIPAYNFFSELPQSTSAQALDNAQGFINEASRKLTGNADPFKKMTRAEKKDIFKAGYELKSEDGTREVTIQELADHFECSTMVIRITARDLGYLVDTKTDIITSPAPFTTKSTSEPRREAVDPLKGLNRDQRLETFERAFDEVQMGNTANIYQVAEVMGIDLRRVKSLAKEIPYYEIDGELIKRSPDSLL